jgi:capsular exopolysaccharide synthesis family protein
VTSEPQHPLAPDPLDAEAAFGTPHLSDYWQVVTRRLGLVLLIFTVTTASSIWAVSRQRVYFQSSMSLQINDPLERQRPLVSGVRVSGMDIFVDPIESEIQVLRSSTIASVVVDSLGMRLRRVPPEAVRSALFRDAQVEPEAPPGRYRLVYRDDGVASLEDAAGALLASARVGSLLDAGFVRFVPRTPPEESRAYALEIVPSREVAAELSFSAVPRESTNIVDVALVHPDPLLVPRALNAAGHVLRDKGADRVRQAARDDIAFIEERIASARSQLQESMDAIREFKKTQAFTDLSAREQQLVRRAEELGDEIEGWESQRALLAELGHSLETLGVEGVDLVSVLARLPEGRSPQVRATILDLEELSTEERRLLAEERMSPGHPRVAAVRAEMATVGRRLLDAARASRRVIETRLAELAERRADLRREQRRFPDLEAEIEALEAQQSLDQDSYQFLLSQLYQAQITEAAASPYVEILDPAAGAQPLQSRGRVNVMLGGLLGLILGVGAAFFLEYLDRTVRTSADVESLLAVPVLGIIPRLRASPDGTEERVGPVGAPLVVAMDPLDPAAEAYRTLRMNLMFMSTEEEPLRTVLFSSPGPSEGKSTTAVNFAIMLARQGKRVLLADADLRRPSIHRALDVLREPGLTNLLVGDAGVREAVRPNVLPNLDFLPSGPFPPNPSELLNSAPMIQLLGELQERYDQIVLDSPPVLAVTDAAILASSMDGVVLVLRSGETEQHSAERAVDQLRRLGVRVLGAVLNEVSPSSSTESDYQQYYYRYAPAEKGGWSRLRAGLAKVRFFG